MKKYSTHKKNYGRQTKKGFAQPSAPLYTKEDFLYYFENRLNQIVKNEVEANFREVFYGMPF